MQGFVSFYRWWHGRLKLKGAGQLLKLAAWVIPSLRSYPLAVAGAGTARLDFREEQSFTLLNLEFGATGGVEHLARQLARHVPEGGVVWDVGANVGLFSLLLCRAGVKASAIHAFEPNPHAYRILQSLYENHPVVKVHPLALGKTKARALLWTTKGDSSVSSLRRTGSGKAGPLVDVYPGDDLAGALGIPLPHVVKIDVEGCEADVLAGMSALIESCRPVVAFEHIFFSDHEITALVPKNYKLCFILDDGELSGEWTLRNRASDALLIPDRAGDGQARPRSSAESGAVRRTAT